MLTIKNQIEDEIQGKLELKDILAIFEGGCKGEAIKKVGIEFERLPISTVDFKLVDYAAENGVYDLLRAFAKLDGWEYITDDYNIVGLTKGADRITLEPGCQFELSLMPEENIADIKTKIDAFDKRINPLLKKYDIKLLEYGISPVSTYNNIKLIPKKRYHIMADYLWGILSDVMMRETAGIQACYDFSSEEDAMRKFRVANLLSPFMTAMFANSPIRCGVDTGYKTFRGLSWLNTDTERCGFINRKIFDGKSQYGFKDYIKDVMQTPMIFIVRNGNTIEIFGKIDFDQFMKNGFEGYHATLDDFKLHANLCFPEVRLRDFIEIRNHDCANNGMQYSVLAIYKGLFYNQTALEQVEDLLSEFNYSDMMELRYNVPKSALNSKIKKYVAADIAKEILKIAQSSLQDEGKGEEQFLEPILELTPHGLSPADVILSHWNGDWKKDVNKLVKYLSN